MPRITPLLARVLKQIYTMFSGWSLQLLDFSIKDFLTLHTEHVRHKRNHKHRFTACLLAIQIVSNL